MRVKLQITMNNVASFKKSVSLPIFYKINLIYGLNGTGKSTISDFLYNQSEPRFKNCKIEGLSNEEIIVYNQKFIQDTFYESDSINGIFTLSKENKDAEIKIKEANEEILKLNSNKGNQNNEKGTLEKNFKNSEDQIIDNIWEIKTTHASGSNDVLDYCFTGLKIKKQLFQHLKSIQKPEQKPEKTVEQLKKEVQAITGNDAQKYDTLSKFNYPLLEIESNEIFRKQIIGNEDSTVSELIKKLGNSDWVKQGLNFLPESIPSDKTQCPFCQEKTITNNLINNIKNFFDETYEKEINIIRDLHSNYQTYFDNLNQLENYTINPFINEKKDTFNSIYKNTMLIVQNNINKINKKVQSPSKIIELENSSQSLKELNDFIDTINNSINEHNSKINNKEKTKEELKKKFWSIMRYEYDHILREYNNVKDEHSNKSKEIDAKIKDIESKITDQNNIIISEQKNTTNIDEAIQNINNALLELGIDGFKIIKVNDKDNLYKIEREHESSKVFASLSEGEKMIISFLYFLELYKGKKNPNEANNKKIVVIDDPVSSLSHIFVFNVGRLIKKYLFEGSLCEHVIILTHSLYFFYELVKNIRKIKETSLNRIEKSNTGTDIKGMKLDEIQNDYQSYWYIIKNESTPPALIANCMRNILEYFFGFVEKKNLTELFNKTTLNEIRFQSFHRYMNRESHSDAINLFDFKEYDYEAFKNAFKNVFELNGFIEHYNKMME